MLSYFDIFDIFDIFRIGGTGGASYNPVFWLNNMGLSNKTAVNTRTSTSTVPNNEGIYVTCEAGETTIQGGRRVRNIVKQPNDLEHTDWTKANATATGPNSVTFNSIWGKVTGKTNLGDMRAGDRVVCRVTISGTGSGANSLNFRLEDSDSIANGQIAVVVTGELTTYAIAYTLASDVTYLSVVLDSNGGTVETLELRDVQVQKISGQSNNYPAEFIDTNTDYGYGVNGVKWYSTTNGNSVASNVVTEAPGTAISPAPQVLMQPQRTSYAWPNQDLTHANWVKTNITAALDATDLSGVANAASTLTATTANGTVFNTITLASAENTTAFYVRRKTGTGTIEISDDGGTSYTDITSSINSSTYTQATVTTTQTNPSIGLRIVTSGDAVEVVSQLETGSTATTLIETATAAATRDNDEGVISDFNNWAPTTSGIMLFAFTPSGDWAALGAEQLVYGGASANLLFRSANDDGLKATDGTSTPSILSGHTPGTEIIASVYWDASINIFQIGYYEMDSTTQHWDASPATFTTLTVDPELIMTKIIDGAVTIRGLQIFNGMPASGVDGASIEAWIEANQEAKINERQA